ncbi:unnamed protein product [Brassica oleracea var. botrytis]|uniref:(rape) hypothetical protein n=1 Tax=Brassica napus TaxID=3708 RepID=A0A816IF03_BRANA|nr:unnamed protein product [Brassica napus]
MVSTLIQQFPRGYVSMTGGSDPYYVLLVILYLYLLSR